MNDVCVDIMMFLCSRAKKDNIIILNKTTIPMYSNSIGTDKLMMFIEELVKGDYLKHMGNEYGQDIYIINPYKYSRTSKDNYYNVTRRWRSI